MIKICTAFVRHFVCKILFKKQTFEKYGTIMQENLVKIFVWYWTRDG